MKNLLTQEKSGIFEKAGPFGTITLPENLQAKYGTNPSALGNLLNTILNALIAFGAIYALINFILAGYAFMSAGDDPKKVAGAWAKIWQTAIGLAFTAGAFVLAAIFGKLIFGDWNAILNPKILTQ